MNNYSQEEILAKVQQIIADLTGNDIDDVLPTAEFEEDLGVTPVDFKRIISELNREFEIDLNAQVLLNEEVNTVKELVIIVREEAVLG